jgi:hypothetical protein
MFPVKFILNVSKQRILISQYLYKDKKLNSGTLMGIIGVIREILQEKFVQMTDIMARISVAVIQQ